MQIPSIIKDLDFTMRVRAKRLGINRYVKVSFTEIANITTNLVRLPSSKTAIACSIDDEGRLIIPVSGSDLVCTTYGLEFLGFYNNGNWRHQIMPAFEIVQASTEDNYALNESDELTIDLEILIGETYASSRALAGTMAEHDAAQTSHPYLLQQLANIANSLLEVAQTAAAGITTHNSSNTAHSDIRQSITGISQSIESINSAIQDMQAEIDEAGMVDDVQIDGVSILNDKVANINSSQFGNVDDVKVNGASVVSGKTAEITVPTKVSQLENDEDFTSQDDVEDMISEASISEASATIDGDTGTPSVEVTKTGSKLEFAFHGCKGQKGDDGDPGPQGPQGDSVLVGQGDLPLAHALGVDNTKAMSQKGVTDAIITDWDTLAREGSIDGGLFVYTSNSTLYAPSTSAGWYKRVRFPVEPGHVYKVQYYDNTDPLPTADRKPVIAFSQSSELAAGDTVQVLAYDSATTEHTIPLLELSTSVESAGYLYVFYRTVSGGKNGGRCYKAKTVQDACREIDSRLTQVEEDVDGIKSLADGELIVSEWTNGQQLKYITSAADPKVTPTYLNTAAGYKVSGFLKVEKGDVIELTGVTAKTFCAIAYSENGTMEDLFQKVANSGAQVTDYTYTWKVSADGYVRVCGSTDSACVIEKASAFVHAGEMSALEDKINEILSSGLPQYWADSLDEREAVIKSDTTVHTTEAFIFITDAHPSESHKMSADVIGHIMANTPVCKTIFGGDVCVTGTVAAGSYENRLFKNMAYVESIREAAKKHGKYYCVHGNHDFFEYAGSTQYNIPYKKVAQYLKEQSQNFDAVFADDENACYYYTDNAETQLRTIFVDACCKTTTGHLRLSLAQLEWIIGKIADSPYDVMIVSHCPSTGRFATTNEQASDYFSCLREVILAANKRESGSVTYTSSDGKNDEDYGTTANYDFTAWNKNVIFYVNGHSHLDNQTYHDGIPFVTVMCDKADHHPYSPFGEGTSLATSAKVKGTAGEQAMDVVSIPIAHDIIIMRRVGLGYDRILHVGEIKLEEGQTYTLTSDLEVASWTSSNCAVGQVSGSTWPYVSDIVSVEDGVVTALAPGEAFVFAEDANHNKEFWAITVE